MKLVLDYIAEKQRAFATLPFFAFLRDSSLSTRDRLLFAPAAAPFIMSFSDLCRYTLVDENSSDPIQQLLNVHAEEDATHYQLYLRDLDTLGFDVPIKYADVLQFLWGDERKLSRLTCLKLTTMFASEPLKLRLAILESVEASAAAAFKVFAELAEEHRAATGQVLRFLGDQHQELEAGHAMKAEDIEAKVKAIEFDPQEQIRARALVDTVFQLFSEMMQELHAYALESQPRKQESSMSRASLN